MFILLTKPSISLLFPVSSASVNRPSSHRTTMSCSRDSLAAVARVFYKSDRHHLLHFLTPQSFSPATHPGPTNPTSRPKAAADRPLSTSPRPSSPAWSRDQWGVIHTTRSWPPRWYMVTPDLLWRDILTLCLRGSLCPSLGSPVFQAAVNAPLWLLPVVQLALSSMCFCPQRLKERRWTVNLWTRASWMSWTVR